MHHIIHLDELLPKDARHRIQLGYHVIHYPRYIPTMVELCRSSFSDIIDKLKADLAYFKDDFWNKEMFEVIHKLMSNKPHPRTGHGASTPKPLDIPLSIPGTTTLRGNPPWVTPVPPLRTTPAPPPRQTPVPSPRLTPTGSLGNAPVLPPWVVPQPRINLSHSHNLSLSLLQYQNLMVGRHEPPCQTHPQATIQCQTTELSLSMDILQAKERAKPKTQVNPLCVSDVAETAIQNITGKTAKFLADTARARCMPPIAVHSFQEPHQPQMVRDLTLLALMDEANKHTCQVHPASRRRSPRTRRYKRRNIHKNLRPSKLTTVLAQYHTRQTEIPSCHHKGNNSFSTHCPHNRYFSMVRLWSSRTPALLLHSDRWLNYISNISRQAKLRQKLSGTLPVLHHSHPQ